MSQKNITSFLDQIKKYHLLFRSNKKISSFIIVEDVNISWVGQPKKKKGVDDIKDVVA